MMCSGAMVFFDSCSHISFASLLRRCINSTDPLVFVMREREQRERDVPTQHSMIKSLVSFAQVISLGNNSDINLATVALGKERSSSDRPPCRPSESDIDVESQARPLSDLNHHVRRKSSYPGSAIAR